MAIEYISPTLIRPSNCWRLPIAMYSKQWKSNFIRWMSSLEWDSLVVFNFLCTSKLWPDKRLLYFNTLMISLRSKCDEITMHISIILAIFVMANPSGWKQMYFSSEFII